MPALCWLAISCSNFMYLHILGYPIWSKLTVTARNVTEWGMLSLQINFARGLEAMDSCYN